VLHVAQAAADAISHLVSVGLRIFPTTETSSEGPFELTLVLTGRPAPSDRVVVDHGSTVFVEQRLSLVLSDKTLDVVDQETDARHRFPVAR
jgi:hypothetical protein